MDDPITYGDLDGTLRAFGFAVNHVPGRHRRYEHADSPALLLLPDRPLEAAAQPFHWMSVRSTLADFGFISRDDFFDIVRKHRRVAS